MEPDRWRQVERIYHDAMLCAPAGRGLLLDQACAGDTALRAEVESLLHYGEAPADFLERPAMEVVAQALADDLLVMETANSAGKIGSRIAQYRIVGKLGSGGMGDVYRAVRADDQYEMQVAIKLVRPDLDTESVAARFRRERQILAGLEHENIARLIDGGTTVEGHPYFVMELVEGKPIDEYCDEARLGTAARIDLFRRVCSAVQYAHQRLVVHRDIKPGNILVTADGVPKLLDFGIATILSPDRSSDSSSDPSSENPTTSRERTETVTRIMTPQFASPEQILGQLITTATDVYSLGVVLYRLLTGHIPYRVHSDSPYELAHAVCEAAPEKPSSVLRAPISQLPPTRDSRSIVQPADEKRTVHGSLDSRSSPEALSAVRGTTPDKLRRTLTGDLDQIVLKALRKEPDRRYASVREFSEDLHSYLRGRPVSARHGTFAYRSGKFIRRNRFVLAATAVFVLLGLIGIAVIVREAHVARLSQARAERRFNDVRSLANSLLFEIHDSIGDLPGSTAARKLLVDRALHYLDSLSEESAGTPGLQRELATAYERVGDVQGNPYLANLGDTAGAIASYRKALGLRLALVEGKQGSYEDRTALVQTFMNLGLGLEVTGDFAASLDALQHAYPIANTLSAERPNDPLAKEMLAGVCFLRGSTLADTGDLAGSLDDYRKSAAIRETIASGSPEFQMQVQTRLAGVYGYTAGNLALLGDLDGAIALQHKARDILAQLAVADPHSARLQQFLPESEYWTGYYTAQKGLAAQALPHYRAALAGYLKLSHADAHDVLAKRYLAKCYVGIGAALTAIGNPTEAIQTVRKAVLIFDALAAADRADNFFKPVGLAYARSAMADAYQRLATSPGLAAAARLADWRQARSWYEQSLDTWLQIKRKGPLGRFDAEQPDKIAHRIAACDAALAKFQSRQ
jgi:serine/threonine protein kinase/tetratricopeptide (TPR) repeat protein